MFVVFPGLSGIDMTTNQDKPQKKVKYCVRAITPRGTNISPRIGNGRILITKINHQL